MSDFPEYKKRRKLESLASTLTTYSEPAIGSEPTTLSKDELEETLDSMEELMEEIREDL